MKAHGGTAAEPNRDVRRSSKFLRGWQWVGPVAVAQANDCGGGFDWAGEVATRQELRSNRRCLRAFFNKLASTFDCFERAR